MIVRNVMFRSDGLTLGGTIFSSDVHKQHIPRPAILIVHGWKGSEHGYLELAHSMASLGATVLTFNLRGHGNSAGEKHAGSRAEYVRDVRNAYRFLLQQPGIDGGQVAAIGSSLGCYLITRAMSRCRFMALAFRTPATYPDQGFRTPFAPQVNKSLQAFRQQLVTSKKNEGIRPLSHFTGSLFIISGGRDRDVPSPTIASYRSAASRAIVTEKVYVNMSHVPTVRQRKHINRYLVRQFARLFG